MDLYDLRAVLEGLLAPATVEFNPVASTPESIAVLSADVLVNGQAIGRAGQIAPGLTKDELRGDVCMATLILGQVALAQSAAAGAFRLPARFPSVTRDLAVVVDRTLNHGRIEATLRAAQEPLLTAVELFDVFTDDTGEKIAADKKSLAYSLTYRAEDRTLRAEEVNAAHARLKSALQAGFSGLQFRE